MERLRRTSSDRPGIARRRRGRGFSYRWPDGSTVTDRATRERIGSLAIPPAWRDVWICPDPLGHLQAAGTDAAGRRQYLYHERWRSRRDGEKFDRMRSFARALPEIRRHVACHLRRRGLSREKALAAAVRMLDLALFRVGSESYARHNGSFGVATLRREHVRVSGDTVRFDYRAKSGQRRRHEVTDPELAAVIRTLKRRRDDHPELLAYRDERGWHDVRARDVNGYVKELSGDGFSAKDFRTWHGTVLTAVALAGPGDVPDGARARRSRVTGAIGEVASMLGNTPAVARASYVDPRVLDRFEQGRTIADRISALDGDLDDPAFRDAVERAVLELLGEPLGTETADATPRGDDDTVHDGHAKDASARHRVDEADPSADTTAAPLGVRPVAA